MTSKERSKELIRLLEEDVRSKESLMNTLGVTDKTIRNNVAETRNSLGLLGKTIINFLPYPNGTYYYLTTDNMLRHEYLRLDGVEYRRGEAPHIYREVN